MSEKQRYMYVTEQDASVIDHRPISSYRLYGRQKIRNLDFCIRIRISSFDENDIKYHDKYCTIDNDTKMIRLYDTDIACVLVRMKKDKKWQIKIDDVFSKSLKTLMAENQEWIQKFNEN